MNPAAPAPSPADDQAVTPLARRIGPPVAAVALLATVGLLAWLAIAPTAIEGPIEEAPFALDALLLVPPDDDGCLQVVEGDGTTLEHCFPEFTAPDADGFAYVEAFFDDRGRLLVGRYPDGLVEVDPGSGEVLGDVEVDGDQPPPEPHAVPLTVTTDGDRVVTISDPPAEEVEVLLDLEAPPGYDLRDAVLSPDGAWLVATTARGEVVVAPADGSAPPYVWVEVDGDRWLELYRGIRWSG